MASQSEPKTRVDADGVRITRAPAIRGSTWWLLGAIALLSLLLIAGVRPLLRGGGETQPPDVEPRPARAARSSSASDPSRPAAPARIAAAKELPAAPVAPPRAGRPEPGDGSAATAAAPADGAAENGDRGTEPTGIALFPPPGTDPPKSGIIVPDGFVLPPGYVRHYQVTDDGQQLAPILMFHPDFQLVDEHGNPVAMPADHIVPAEMAPPGLAIEMLQIPDTELPVAEVPAGQGAQDAAP